MNEGITVLSLFDGISCGRLALKRAGIKVKTYFAAEIKPIAIKCAMANFPDTVQIGDVTKVSFADGILKTEMGEFDVGEIDLLLGGSPCQDFTIVKYINQRETLGLAGEKSKLFYEYLRLKQQTSARFFLLENVEMRKDREQQLNEFLRVDGVHINSALVSYQNRPRVYWTNIPGVKVPADRGIDFQDYIETGGGLEFYKVNRTPSREKMWNDGRGHEGLGNCNNVTYSKKIYCITRKQDRFPNSGLVEYEDFCRYLTRKEIEVGQTLPVGYTDCLTYNQMQDVCGDGFTVEVVAHILKFLLKQLRSEWLDKLLEGRVNEAIY